MSDSFVWDPAEPPLSFRYGSKDSAALLPAWKRTQTAEKAPGGSVTHITYDDQATGLRMVAHVRRFEDFGAVEWVLEFENRSGGNSPIIEDILPLDILLPADPKDRLRLHHAKGSECNMDDFLPRQDDLWPWYRPLKLAPRGGRSSDGVLPFMNLQRPGGGMVLAVGWSGQWAATFQRNDERLRMTAGMEKTHLLLHPGERIRTPRILVIDWSGDDSQAGNNLLRQLLLTHYLPRLDGQLVMPPVAQSLQGYYYLTGDMSADLEMQALPKVAALGAEAYWIDACWFGQGREWWEEVGTWTINRKRYPQGLRPISDAARAKGMRFILWFEPSRVRTDAPIAREHPDYVLRSPHDKDNLLLNFGLPEARAHIVETFARIIAEQGVDVYREDFTFEPLPYWQAADAPDRVGMTEIRFVKGHYEFWDELRRRFPRLWIDNCASGGRMIDLETMSRSLPLWPSDFIDIGGVGHGLALHAADQCIRFGLARWVPLMGGSLWSFTPYSTRSAMVCGFMFYMDLEQKDYPDDTISRAVSLKGVIAKGHPVWSRKFPTAAAKAAIAEWKSVRPFFTGDMYMLLPLTVASHDWCAVQFHRTDLNQGAAMVFRRHKSPLNQMEVGLRAIDPKGTYRVSISRTYKEASRRRMTGRALAKLLVTIPDKPGSLLIR